MLGIIEALGISNESFWIMNAFLNYDINLRGLLQIIILWWQNVYVHCLYMYWVTTGTCICRILPRVHNTMLKSGKRWISLYDFITDLHSDWKCTYIIRCDEWNKTVWIKTHKSLYFTYLLNKIFIIVQCKHSLHRDHLHSWKHGLNIQIQVIFTWTHQVFNKFLSFHCSYNYKSINSSNWNKKKL